MSAKKYVVTLTAILYVFLISNLILWHVFLRDNFIHNDLDRMGTSTSREVLNHNAEYSRRHVELRDYLKSGVKESFDIVTLGDSFTNGGGGTYYQDYLTDKYNLKILNVQIVNHCLSDLYMFASSGLLDEVKPKIVILEAAAASVQDRLGDIEIVPFSMDIREIERRITRKSNTAERISTGFFAPVMTKVCMNFLYNQIYHMIYPDKLSPEVHVRTLNKNVFTRPGQENILAFHRYDIRYITMKLNPELMTYNLNRAADMLREKNIQMIFMPCVNKLDLYHPYIIDKRNLPDNELFDVLRNLPDKKYTFIDTKAILQDASERGEKDLYWAGDSHWSWHGAEIVDNELVKYILP